MPNKSENPETKTERLADLIADRIFYHITDHDLRLELKELLIEFAAEIKRSTIEP